MPGTKGHSGGRRNEAAAARGKQIGRSPQSMTLRLGDSVALRYGWGTPLELGEVTEIHRGVPRTAVVELRSGTTVWLLVETPKE